MVNEPDWYNNPWDHFGPNGEPLRGGKMISNDLQAMAMCRELADEIRAEATKTGRKPDEILQCLIDEGYVDPDQEAIDKINELLTHG